MLKIRDNLSMIEKDKNKRMFIDNLENIRILITLRGTVIEVCNRVGRTAFCNILWTDSVNI